MAYTACHVPLPMTLLICYHNNYDTINMLPNNYDVIDFKVTSGCHSVKVLVISFIS